MPKWSVEKSFEVNIWMTGYFEVTQQLAHMTNNNNLKKCMAKPAKKNSILNLPQQRNYT